ncbi:hypothetical protein FHX42_002896 [Saccharopolyspora lacisalsi]|uniref:Uncharacterized protein n=1 Tax=Halosaccharopolyspora lacisalsi TaxID=1000566 RepID=A0A839E1G2_9PSEU|nr:hypothetical protein [Halosaccharopolyspora lacisalsi]MBA8825545.1 hypothetical protein [Halosaccharopolyspora lacisalsi]
MPIRTHRGRAAVYRRLWGWPLRSPKHLIVAVVLFVAAASGVGLLLPEPPQGSAAREEGRGVGSTRISDGSPTESASSTSSLESSPPSISVPTESPKQAPPNPDGLATVEAWGKQWIKHAPGTTSSQWLERLKPYTTPEFITQMATINPANIAATKITGPVTATSSTATAMRVRLPTDAGVIEVRVVDTDQGWRVANYEKVA